MKRRSTRTVPCYRIFLPAVVLASALFALQAPSAQASECKWKVKGRVLVDDQYFNNAVVPLRGASVRIYASTLNSGGWRFWSEKTINSNGYYETTVKPAESDPIGCAKKRRFKVKLKLSNSDVIVMRHPGPQVWNDTLFITGKKSKSQAENLGAETLDTYSDSSPHTTVTSYTMTHAALMFLAYQQITERLDDWGLTPERAKLLYPDGSGTQSYLGWCDPAWGVKIARSWFSHGDNQWRRRELTHELMHHWFNSHVFVPGFISGKTTSTHDFLETPELTLYEEFAEWAAVAVNEEIWGFVPTNDSSHRTARNDYIRTRHSIYDSFVDAEFGPGNPGTSYWYWEVLQVMIDENSEQWNDYLGRANVSVKNYLRLLTVDDWYFLDYGDDYTSGSHRAELRPLYVRAAYDCSSVRSPMFTAQELLHYFVDWKQSSPGNVVPTPRGVLDFYQFLAESDPHFGSVKRYFRRFGNPHYAGDDFLDYDFCEPSEPALGPVIGLGR